jgi:hypothetical protein
MSNLAETFDNLRKFKMKLNTEKCTFGVPSGQLLRYMVSRCDIDLNPEKATAMTKMRTPASLHDVQKLTGCMAALSQFISGDCHFLSSPRNMTSSSGLRKPLKT